MKKLFHLSKIFVVLSIAAFSAVESNAQCKGFVKKQIPKLAPFIHNGQINTYVLLAGDNDELTIKLYSGKTYSIMVD